MKNKTKEQIAEYNRLIAEFDGWKLRKEPFINSDEKIFPWWEKFEDGKVVKTYHHDILRAEGKFEFGSYHSSWDWLMPVVEKISRLKVGDGVEYVECSFPVTFGMIDDEGRSMVRLSGFLIHKADTLIEAAFEAVVEFIWRFNSINS
jgi:hypothetical protein